MREQEAAESEAEALARVFTALATPTRVRILHRLRAPAFAADLAEELDLSRQAIAKHLEILQEAGLVEQRPGKRGFLPAIEYEASPAGLFVFKESVQQLAAAEGPATGHATLLARWEAGAPSVPAPALLVVHGRVRGEWLPLRGGPHWSLGRTEANEIALTWDRFASARHALLVRDGSEWSVTDLGASNRTLLNFAPLPPNRPIRVRDGDLLVIGRSVLALRI